MTRALWLFLFLSSSTFAGTVQVEVGYPETRVDGTPFSESEVGSVVIQYGTCGTEEIDQVVGDFSIPGPEKSGGFEYPPGEVCVRAKIIDRAGLQSAWTNTARGVIPEGSPPGVPVIIEITFLPLPPPSFWVVAEKYNKPNYKTVSVFFLSGEELTENVGMVTVGVPCNCEELRVELDSKMTPGTELGIHCSIKGQLQTQFNKPVARGEPFPEGYIALCKEETL